MFKLVRKPSIYLATLFFAFVVTSCGIIPTQADSSIDAVNVDESAVAIKGYDPVAYFTLNEPTLGNAEFQSSYLGATYYFSSAKHKTLFQENPAKYAPQYGGYCAFGVSKEKKYDTDPSAFAVVDGKLYLNLNAKVQERWLLNTEELISDADGYWAVIENTPVAEL